MSLPLVIATITLAWAMGKTAGSKDTKTICTFKRKRPMTSLGWTRPLAFSFCLLSSILCAGIPLLTLSIMSIGGWTKAIETGMGSFIQSVWLAGIGATILCVMGFLIAYFRRGIFDPILLSTLAFPSALIGIGLIKIFNVPVLSWVYASPAIILVGYLARNLPLISKAYSPFFSQLSPNIEEAAYSSGAGYLRVAHRIVAPLLKRASLACWAMGFALCIRELEVTLLVSPAGMQTLPNRIFTLLHYGDVEVVSALSLMVVALVAAPVAIYWSVQKVIGCQD